MYMIFSLFHILESIYRVIQTLYETMCYIKTLFKIWKLYKEKKRDKEINASKILYIVILDLHLCILDLNWFKASYNLRLKIITKLKNMPVKGVSTKDLSFHQQPHFWSSNEMKQSENQIKLQFRWMAAIQIIN